MSVTAEHSIIVFTTRDSFITLKSLESQSYVVSVAGVNASVKVLIPYKFKGAASALYSSDGTWEITERDNGGYSVWASIVNIGTAYLVLFSKVTL